MSLLRQGRLFLIFGALQLLLDWAVFVALTGLGMPTAPGNVCGRVAGAALGFWLNGRWTFASDGQARLGWERLWRFVAVWLSLTALSTLLLAAIAAHAGLQHAWLAKPLVEAGFAVVSFFLWRHVVFR
ncbi:MAG: GtrA family protein [Pseudoxanthomonas sp.]